MALVVSKHDEKPRKSSFRGDNNKKPWMLRDYLKDDMSSCSSNGFKSFPRKQCCAAAVKNIIDKEKITRGGRIHSKPPKKMLVKNRSTLSSALQRASMAVINAVKLLPFHGGGGVSGGGRRLLPRSFSKKLFKRSLFWKKEKKSVVSSTEKNSVVEECDDEIERWISSGVVGKEKYEPLDLSNDTTVTNDSTTSNSNSNISSDGKSSDSWSDITFTSCSLSENDQVVVNVIERREKVLGKVDDVSDEEEEVSKSYGVTSGDYHDHHQNCDPAVNKPIWHNKEAEKDQLSPISVMDFPYDDEGSASPFTLRISRLKGTTDRLMKKLGRFESLASGLEPINLERLMSSTVVEDVSLKQSVQSCSTPSFILSSESDSEELEEEEEEESQEDEAESRVQNLLNIMKLKRFPKFAYKFDPDSLLLDFFRENAANKTDDDTLLKSAEDWINGHYDELILGWEVKDKRQAYISDMEEGERWPRNTRIEKEEVAIELGGQVFATLIEEMMVEFCSS